MNAEQLRELGDIKNAIENDYSFTDKNWSGKRDRSPREDMRFLVTCLETETREVGRLKEELDSWIEREALVCPEDTSFEELIKLLRERVKQLEAGIENIADQYELSANANIQDICLALRAFSPAPGKGGEG